MIAIESQADMDRLRSDGALPQAYFDAVEQYFNQLREAYPTDALGIDFVLDSGHIVILQPDDSDSDLDRLMSSWPEYGELLLLDTCEVVKIVVMEDNDNIMTFFVERGLHLRVDAWIEPYLEPIDLHDQSTGRDAL